MSKIWDERQKSLEEEYFRRKEQELIEQMRAKRAEAERQASAIQCPKCEGTLDELTFDEIQIDRCNKCNGVWLDAGEMERLIGKQESHGWLSRLWRGLAGE